MSFPTKDTLLVPYSTNWNNRLGTASATFGLTVEQATQFSTLYTAYTAAYTVISNAREAGTRSKSLTANKDDARAALVAFGRQLYAFVQANTSVSDGNKALLGVAVRSGTVRPVPPPTVAPALSMGSVSGRTFTVRIYDPKSLSKRAKLPEAVSAWVYTFVGNSYPSDPTLWQFSGTATKYEYAITLPDTVAGGSQVWVTAAWATRKGDTGPVAVPVSTYIQGGGTQEQQNALKIAA